MNAKLHHFELVFKNIQSDKERLENEARALEARFSETSAINAKQEATIKQLETDLKQQDRASTESDELRVKVAELSGTLLESETVNTRLLDENQRLLSDINDLESRLKVSEASVSSANDQLVESRQELEQSVSAKDGLISSLQAEVSEIEQRLQDMALECTEKQSRIDQLVQDKLELEADVTAQARDLELVRVKYESENQRLNAECSQSSSELTRLKKESAAVAKLREGLTQAEDRNALLRKEFKRFVAADE